MSIFIHVYVCARPVTNSEKDTSACECLCDGIVQFLEIPTLIWNNQVLPNDSSTNRANKYSLLLAYIIIQ